MSIVLKATLSVRTPRGQFPPGSYARVLLPAREVIRADTRLAFDRRADPVNWQRWPARKGHYDWPPLVKTGGLKGAAIRAAATAVISGSSLVARVPHPHARFHQRGTRTIAARRFVGVSLQALNATRRALAAEGVRVMRGRG